MRNLTFRITAGLLLLVLVLLPADVFAAESTPLNPGLSSLTVAELVVIGVSVFALASAVVSIINAWRQEPAETRSAKELDQRIADTVTQRLRDEELTRALRTLVEQQTLQTQILMRNFVAPAEVVAEWTPTEIDDALIDYVAALLADSDTRGTIPPYDASPDADSPMAGPESGF
jgi:hypothetical protein